MNKNLMAAMQYAKQNQKPQAQKMSDNTPAGNAENTTTNTATDNAVSPRTGTNTANTMSGANKAADTTVKTTHTPNNQQSEHSKTDSSKTNNQATDDINNQSLKTIITPHADTLMANKNQKPNQPVFKKVDISIIGMPYRIDCPIEEVNNLTKSANAINDALKELRRNIRGKLPSNEELLVLYCLELYDDLQNAKAELDKWQEQQTMHGEFVDKLIKELQ